MVKTILKEQIVSPTSIWRMDLLPENGLELIKTLNQTLTNADIEKDTTAHEELLRLGEKISHHELWEIKGRESETFIQQRRTVM